MLSEEAKAAGFTMPEDEQASVDSLLQQIEENAESEKLSWTSTLPKPTERE
ncbi:MAG: hypothetical protein ACLR23_05030 [Clostridia bacterium]